MRIKSTTSNQNTMSLTTIKYTIKVDGNIEEKVLGVDGHACQKITYPIENDIGDVVSRNYLKSFFITDSSPIEANIQRLEDEDWRGCCNTWGCAL
tara:strand:- start:307 stop:591 length:285 start_codon:yes stop_codon:yes gene_type:complete